MHLLSRQFQKGPYKKGTSRLKKCDLILIEIEGMILEFNVISRGNIIYYFKNIYKFNVINQFNLYVIENWLLVFLYNSN